MKPFPPEKSLKICKRCGKNSSVDPICPSCKNELLALYDNKVSWRTAYEIEKISKKAMLYSRFEREEE